MQSDWTAVFLQCHESGIAVLSNPLFFTWRVRPHLTMHAITLGLQNGCYKALWMWRHVQLLQSTFLNLTCNWCIRRSRGSCISNRWVGVASHVWKLVLFLKGRAGAEIRMCCGQDGRKSRYTTGTLTFILQKKYEAFLEMDVGTSVWATCYWGLCRKHVSITLHLAIVVLMVSKWGRSETCHQSPVFLVFPGYAISRVSLRRAGGTCPFWRF